MSSWGTHKNILICMSQNILSNNLVSLMFFFSNFGLDMFRFLSTCWMRELRNPFALDRSPTFWHKNQTPDRAGLILGQNPPCKELNSSQTPVKCPRYARGERADQSFFYNLIPRKIVEMYEGWWQTVGMYGKKKKKSTTNETLSQFLHCRKIKQFASLINVL